MERVIKFRAKSKFTGLWVYGYPRLTAIGNWVLHNGNRKYVIDPETLGRFTGLIDESYHEIYEGDIIQGCYKYEALGANGGVIPDNDCLCKGVVKFSNYTLQWVLDVFWAQSFLAREMKEADDFEIPLVDFGYEGQFSEAPMDCLEVIGNIFSNPELINPQNIKEQ